MKKALAGVAALVALLASLTACGRDNFKDVKNVQNVRPDYIVNIENMDKHPNIGLVCYAGVGFATTTRSYSAVLRVPEWDALCRAHIK